MGSLFVGLSGFFTAKESMSKGRGKYSFSGKIGGRLKVVIVTRRRILEFLGVYIVELFWRLETPVMTGRD